MFENAEQTEQETVPHERAFPADTLFLIQTGRSSGRFKTYVTTKGRLSVAVMLFKKVKIGKGGKKRLLGPGGILMEERRQADNTKL